MITGGCRGPQAPPPPERAAGTTAAVASAAVAAHPAAEPSPAVPPPAVLAEPRPAAPAAPTGAVAVPEPPPAPADGRLLRQAPEAYDHLILRASYPPVEQYQNLRYEGHNGLLSRRAATGEEVAERWRSLVSGTRGVFLLRDSLWSQQDHPYHRRPYALMMPPSWVTVAVAEVAADRAIRPVLAPPLEDDAAWAAIATPADLFGSFPPSDSLHREATKQRSADPQERRYTEAARASVSSLARDVAALTAAAGRGPRAVAEAGAERIVRSDERYFGRALRYHRVIPIFVENPNTRELVDEGKGMVPPGLTIAADLVNLTRDIVYRRRLQAGDLAVERYDLSVPAERQRALAVLEALIPPAEDAPKTTLWLWVTGRLDQGYEARGQNAVPYLPALFKLLEGAKIDRSRLQIVSKPATELPAGPGRAAAFRSDARWYRHRGLPYAVQLSSYDLTKLLLASP